MSREARFKFITETQATEAEVYAHGMGYQSIGALARVLVLRTMKQYPLSGRQKRKVEESYGTTPEGGSGVLPSTSTGRNGED
ncbi:MAG TPA: hypothetical protein VJ553_04950 [Candidatus Paceibacterota bacterium]|nr:hypothetical protein [Candidatus Paceibacterota bacterium]